MSADPPIPHGGRLDLARRMFPHAPEPWIDLSTGIGPYPYPLGDLPHEAFTRLPDAEAQGRLEGIAARRYRAGPAAEVVAAAGVQAIIQWLPQVVPARRVAVLGFAYAEHEARWRAAGASVARVPDLADLERADVGVVVNPNNPDGRLVPATRLAETARRMAESGGLLVVDEAFMDFSPLAASLAPLAGMAGLVVLRSFGKAYGLPGLRLGFALCDGALAARLRAALGPWAVCGPALAIGASALADEIWLAQKAAQLEKDAARLDALLETSHLDIMGGTSLFRLARSAGAQRWFAHLCGCGILTRRFEERPEWLRFGLPATSSAWDRLARALESGHGAREHDA
ncbi:MAG TPA: threonine-phosphate decarboxylase CobD [Methylosinus sp.]